MDYPRPKHPEMILHKMFLSNINTLIINMKDTKADKNDMLYNFFSQFIQASLGQFDETFKKMVSKSLYNDFTNLQPRIAAARVIKSIDLGWPEQFMDFNKPRIYLSDIRNTIVFEFWSTFQHMIEAQWMPETNTSGTEEQNELYKKVAHTIGSRILDPKDSERINQLLIWMHYLKLIHYVKNNINELQQNEHIEILNTCSGAWLYTYNKYGMAKLIWELFLDITHYDNEG